MIGLDSNVGLGVFSPVKTTHVRRRLFFFFAEEQDVAGGAGLEEM